MNISKKDLEAVANQVNEATKEIKMKIDINQDEVKSHGKAIDQLIEDQKLMQSVLEQLITKLG